ncbi:MAG TPA: transcriptional repressor [Solirubrobacteraceae bacterium]|nr:transcriptional repressor [Solirubrobacteraceae bacterium]
MTVAQLALPRPAGTLASAIAQVRARGLRVSTPRRLILEALFDADGPVTAETLASRLPGGGDLASVYRNLERLEAIGLVLHVHLGHGPGLYALATPRDLEFVTCEVCGAFEAVDAARLDAVRALIRSELGYRARFTHFPIVGLCAACQAARPPARRPRSHDHRH